MCCDDDERYVTIFSAKEEGQCARSTSLLRTVIAEADDRTAGSSVAPIFWDKVFDGRFTTSTV